MENEVQIELAQTGLEVCYCMSAWNESNRLAARFVTISIPVTTVAAVAAAPDVDAGAPDVDAGAPIATVVVAPTATVALIALSMNRLDLSSLSLQFVQQNLQ